MLNRPMNDFSLPPPGYITRRRFEELVEEAVESIPESLWKAVDNLMVVVEDWPARRHHDAVALAPGHLLLGLYEGVPLTKRSSHYGMVTPDKITIFRGPILRVTPPDEDSIREQVRRTVLHEIAHHFGISDERLMELGAY